MQTRVLFFDVFYFFLDICDHMIQEFSENQFFCFTCFHIFYSFLTELERCQYFGICFLSFIGIWDGFLKSRIEFFHDFCSLSFIRVYYVGIELLFYLFFFFYSELCIFFSGLSLSRWIESRGSRSEYITLSCGCVDTRGIFRDLYGLILYVCFFCFCSSLRLFFVRIFRSSIICSIRKSRYRIYS